MTEIDKLLDEYIQAVLSCKGCERLTCESCDIRQRQFDLVKKIDESLRSDTSRT